MLTRPARNSLTILLREKEATYKKGAIVRMKLENFVTYGNVRPHIFDARSHS